MSEDWSYTFETDMGKQEIIYTISNEGIIADYYHYDRDDDRIKDLTSVLWVWTDFKILRVIHHANLKTSYDYTIDQKVYMNQSLKQMREDIAVSHLVISKSKQIFGPLIKIYIAKHGITSIDSTQACGFTKEGWHMPDEYCIEYLSGIQQKMGETFNKIFEFEVNETKAKEYMHIIYDNLFVSFKDIIFAYGMIMPFMYALRDHTKLIPPLCLGSINNQTGKTTAAVCMTNLIWNNNYTSILTKDNMATDSRAGEYLSSSTFGLVVDDCGELSSDTKGMVKTYTTEEAHFIRKNPDQSIKLDRAVTNPIIYTWNLIPAMFIEDDALGSRCLFLPIFTKITNNQRLQYEIIECTVPKGYLGRYIYECTRELNLSILSQQYDSININEKLNIRQNTIFKLIKLGQQLLQNMFGIKLKTNFDKTLTDQILNSPEFLSDQDDLSLTIIAQIKGKYFDDVIVIEDRPVVPWALSPIVAHTHNRELGILYLTPNKQDLERFLNRRFSFDKLRHALQKRWPTIPNTTQFRHEYGSTRGIFIPNNCWDIDIKDVLYEKLMENAIIEKEDHE